MKVAFLTTDSREHFKDYSNPQPYFGTAPEALLEGFQMLPDQIEVHVVSCLQQPPISSPKKLAENIYYHPLVIPKIGWMRTGYQGCIRAVRRKLREIFPDVVHGQGTERDCAISAVFSGFPNVLTIHGVMSSILRATHGRPFTYYWFAKHLETMALRRTNGVIAISPYVDSIVSTIVPRTWLIPNALRLPFFQQSPSATRDEGPPRLLNVGVISPNKRQLELLQNLTRLREELPFSITFLGRADPLDVYSQKFKALLQATCDLYGGFKHHDTVALNQLLRAYDASDAMIHFSSEESFGLIFAEASARNLPIFASDVGAVRQISRDAPHCQIFDADDFAGLASAIAEWIRAKEYLAARPHNPNSAIESRYHPRVVAKEHLHAYKSVIRTASH